MATVYKCVLESKDTENSQTTQYTAPTGTKFIIDKFTVYNRSGAAATLTINMVASGGSAAASNVKLVRSVAIGETYTLPEIVGHVLNAGDLISTLASAASALVIRISGREIS